MSDSAMHPTGACTCGGEGECEWCEDHCISCGSELSGEPCRPCSGTGEQFHPLSGTWWGRCRLCDGKGTQLWCAYCEDHDAG